MSDLATDFPFDPTSPLTPTGNLRRRELVSRLAAASATGAAFLALAVLGVLVYSVAHRGAPALSWHFLTANPPLFGGAGGGIASAIVGTALIVAVATAIAMPIGVLIAVYLTEFAGARPTRAVRLVLDLLNGLPTIVIALFVFGLLVAGHHQSGLAGSFALSIIMLPLIARASQEVLLLVPQSLREAADALGGSRWRTIVTVVVPSALGGIVTATILAVARAAGETAPLLILSSIYNDHKLSVDMFGQAIPNIPVTIFTLSEQADPAGFARAWGAALVLLAFILIVSLGARALLARSRAKLTR
jgi:phosphate transport system permease protein